MASPASTLPQRKIWLMRAVFLFVYGSYGTAQAYRYLYYRRVGLSETEIGLLIGLSPLAMLLAGPLWSLLADRLGLRERLLALVTGLSILPNLGMIWMQSFGALLLLSLLHSFFMGPIQPLIDSSALSALGDERHRYPTLRAYGSLGYAAVAWVTGILLEGVDIRWVFVGYAALMGVGSVLSLRLEPQEDALQRSFGEGLRGLLHDRAWVLFVAAAFVAMMAQAVAFSYLGLYLDTLGAPESTIGFATALGSAGQTVMLLGFLPWLLKRWGSQRLLALSLFAYGLRFAVWAFLPYPWVVTLSQILLGLTFGATLVASVDFADRHAPKGMRATSQALITSLVSGLGRSSGGMLAGALYDGYGAQSAFGIFAGLSAAAGLAYAATWKRATPE